MKDLINNVAAHLALDIEFDRQEDEHICVVRNGYPYWLQDVIVGPDLEAWLMAAYRHFNLIAGRE